MTHPPRAGRLSRRMSGVLLHPTSLPSAGPIGTLGRAAYEFIDFLATARQQVWQMLPIVPTGPGGTPYVGSSAFAGNTYLLDAQALIEAGYLDPMDMPVLSLPSPVCSFLQAERISSQLVRRAYSRFAVGAPEPVRRDFAAFCEREAYWLTDYTLFMALKQHLSGVPWYGWPESLAAREPSARSQARKELKEAIEEVGFGQFLFERQFSALKQYAAERSILLVGDIPIYVSLDSSDVWANQEIFELDLKGRPTVVAGVPPDYFSATGQRWGNPLYRWDTLKKRDYGWWVRRFERTFQLFDVVRIDHFRGFESYWAIPEDQPSAVVGEWKKGPGLNLFAAVKRDLGPLAVIAEDLGIITDAVTELREALGFPGMKILQFASFAEPDHPYLPENYTPNCVVYPGTHDNNTTLGWYTELDEPAREAFHTYLGGIPDSPGWALVQLAWGSKANLAVAPMQDLLGLDADHRMNTPAKAFGNWQWRMLPGMMSKELTQRLARLTEQSGRS